MSQKDYYQVIARKYRPKKFNEVLGQDTIITILKNAISLKQVAHAYIFSGTRGTGKTTLARIFSKCLNCLNKTEDVEPCNNCESCQEINRSQAIDVLEIDGASHRSIEDIRYINDTIAFSPIKSDFKIFIIDEVHMLTKEAFNALLKTLEEPPSHVKFLFATTELHKIPETILSRCQVLNLKRLTLEQTMQKLSKVLKSLNVNFEEQALKKIAERSEGSLRDAESLLEQLLAFNSKNINESSIASSLGIAQSHLIEDVNKAILNKDFEAMFSIANIVFQEGYQINFFLEQLISYFKNILLNQCKNNLPSNINYSEEKLLSILEFLGESSYRLKQTIFEKSFLEMVLIQLINIHSSSSIKSFVQKLKSLEKEVLSELSKTSNISKKNQDYPIKEISSSSTIENTKKVTTLNTPLSQTQPSHSQDNFNLTPKCSHIETSDIHKKINSSNNANHLNTDTSSLTQKNSSITNSIIKTTPMLSDLNVEEKKTLSSEEKLQSDILMQFAAVEFNSTLIKE